MEIQEFVDEGQDTITRAGHTRQRTHRCVRPRPTSHDGAGLLTTRNAPSVSVFDGGPYIRVDATGHDLEIDS